MDSNEIPDLSVIIVSYNTRGYLQRCIDDLFAAAASDRLTLEVIVVDNGSTDGSIEMLETYRPPLTILRNDTNVGFAIANGQGFERVRAETALLLNSDAFVAPDVLLGPLEILANNDHVGMVGVRLMNLDGSIQAEAGRFPSFWDDVRTSVGLDQIGTNQIASPPLGPVDWVQGACMFVRMTAMHDVGGLDVRYFMYSEEVDWCRRFWDAGWQVWYAPGISVTHVGGGSSKRDNTARRVALYRSRIGFRRRLGGPASSATLWLLILIGLALRIPIRWCVSKVTRRHIGRHTPSADLALLSALLRIDPFARWVTSQAV